MRRITEACLLVALALALPARAELAAPNAAISVSDVDLLPIDLDTPAPLAEPNEGPWYWRTWQPETPWEWSALAAAEVLIVIDVLQTRDALSRADEGFHEMNPFLGSHPSDARLFATAGAVMVAVALAEHYLPRPWRNVLTVGISAYEVPNTIRSAILGARIRF